MYMSLVLHRSNGQRMKDESKDGLLRENRGGGGKRKSVGGAAEDGCIVHEGMVAGFARHHCENTRN